MDTLTEASMIVHKHDGTKMKFLESKNGLYYDDAAKDTKAKSAYYTFVQLVSKNKSLYTRRQLKAADLGNQLYKLVSRPSHPAFLHMIREHELRNCPITTGDANRALKIYGTNVDTLRGTTMWTTPEHVPSNRIQPLPFEILDAHKEVTLCVDLFFVDRITVLGSVCSHLSHKIYISPPPKDVQPDPWKMFSRV
jgi:hypothetical protein